MGRERQRHLEGETKNDKKGNTLKKRKQLHSRKERTRMREKRRDSEMSVKEKKRDKD